MKQPNFLLMSMFLILNIISVYSQQTKIPVDPKRAALGQTKWISNQLKLDESLQSRIYDINLKYQLKMDSIRLTENDIRQKNNIYQLMVMKKDDEFKRVLTPEMYSEYQLMIEALRIKALGYREAIKK